MAEFNFKPFQKVLVRDNETNRWNINFYGYYSDKDDAGDSTRYVHNCCCESFRCCIPYEGNEHLLGTTDPYVEPYVPKDGDFVFCEGIGGEKIAICKSIRDFMIYRYASFNKEYNKLMTSKGDHFTFEKIRPATDSEKKQLLDALHEAGKKWNPDKKCIEDIVYEPKNGDFFVLESPVYETKFIAICNRVEGSAYRFYAGTVNKAQDEIDFNNYYTIGKSDTIRPATEEERQRLLEAMRIQGRDWDAEKKEIVEYRWRPKEKEYYWTIYGDGRIDCICKATESDAMHIKIGNCFRTEAEAQAMADKFKQLLKGGKG